jgi:hypothetical protein
MEHATEIDSRNVDFLMDILVKKNVDCETQLFKKLEQCNISHENFIKTIGFHVGAKHQADMNNEHSSNSIDVDSIKDILSKPPVAKLMQLYEFEPVVGTKKFNLGCIISLRKKKKKTNNKRKREEEIEELNGISMKVFPNATLHITGAKDMTEVKKMMEFSRQFTFHAAGDNDDKRLEEWIIHKFGLNIINSGFSIGKTIDRLGLQIPEPAFDDVVDHGDPGKRQHIARRFKLDVDGGDINVKKYKKTQPNVFVFCTGYILISARSFTYFDTLIDFVNTNIVRPASEQTL